VRASTRRGPAIAYTIGAPTNNGSYDVGSKVGFTFSASDVDGVASLTAKVDGTMNVTSGSGIDVDSLASGAHTIVISATDNLGNVQSVTITFQVHATINGLINAVNDGYSRGFMTLAEKNALITQLESALKGNSARPKLDGFIKMTQGDTGITSSSFRSLLLNWTNDLLTRL
jgi:hypothetical protein